MISKKDIIAIVLISAALIATGLFIEAVIVPNWENIVMCLLVLGIIWLCINFMGVIFSFLGSFGKRNLLKQKELELRERELILKETKLSKRKKK